MSKVKTVMHTWCDIFRAFKMAFDPKKMVLGYAGLLASLAWCSLVAAFFSALKLIDTTPAFFTKLVLFSVKESVQVIVKSVFSSFIPLDFGKLFAFGVFVFGLLMIWSLVGGAITRLAALDYAKDESGQLSDALKFARKKIWSYFWSPLVPVIGVFFFALCNVIVGLIGRIPVVGEVFIAIGFPFALISGFFMVFIGAIGALGLCFMFPTISAEGSDAFDAMSRAYSYVLSRPKQFLFYCMINVLYGLVCLFVIAFVAWLMIRLSFFTVETGMGQKFSLIQSFISQKCNIACLGFCGAASPDVPTATISLDRWTLKFFAGMLIVYIFLIKLAVWSYLTTYLFSAKTIIYFLLRKEIDSTGISDVYMEENEQKTEKAEMTEKRDAEPSSHGDKQENSFPDKERNR